MTITIDEKERIIEGDIVITMEESRWINEPVKVCIFREVDCVRKYDSFKVDVSFTNPWNIELNNVYLTASGTHLEIEPHGKEPIGKLQSEAITKWSFFVKSDRKAKHTLQVSNYIFLDSDWSIKFRLISHQKKSFIRKLYPSIWNQNRKRHRN